MENIITIMENNQAFIKKYTSKYTDWYSCNDLYCKKRKIPICLFDHSHKKQKNSLGDSLNQALFASELELPKDTSTQATSVCIKYKH